MLTTVQGRPVDCRACPPSTARSDFRAQAQAIVLMAAAPATYAAWPALMKPPLPRRSSSVAAHPLRTRLLTNPKSIHRLPGVRERYWRSLSGQRLIRELPKAQAHSLPLARSRSLKRFLEARRARLKSKAPHNSGRKFNGVKVNLDAKPELNLLGVKVNLDEKPELNLLGVKATLDAKPELNLLREKVNMDAKPELNLINLL
ncbi:hypothetical protein M5K25_018548 [Dendrobium thyrsiflorum]|uniref:Uncharacterized protein n=1 Tax=Dendrobium thyrsiflorum TaxID=117978 RepID=A0ABD0UQF3_DENTH